MERSVAILLLLASLLAMPAAGIAQVTRPAPPQTTRISRADFAALRDAEERGQRRVAQLTAQAAATPAGLQLLALQRQIEQAKLDGRLEFLAALAVWAHDRGNVALAAQAEATAQRLRLLSRTPSTGSDMPREKAPAPQEVRP